MCRICHGVLVNPMECRNCENCFCMLCLKEWLKESGTCPFKCSDDPDFKMKPHKLIRNLLASLKITCKYADNGCQEVIDYEKLEIHEKVNCKFAMYDCPEKKNGCKEKMLKGDIESHVENSCRFSKIECGFCC